MRMSAWSSDVCSAELSARLQTKSGGKVDARFVAVQFPNGEMVRFSIIAPAGGLARIEQQMIRSVNTLKYLSEQEAAALKPLRLKETGRAACRERACYYG